MSKAMIVWSGVIALLVTTMASTARADHTVTEAGDPSDAIPDVIIDPDTGGITIDTAGLTIDSVVIDSAAGIFNGPNSPSWDAPGDFAADIDTQISMPISFTNPGYAGVDDLGAGIIGGAFGAGFDFVGDLDVVYLENGGATHNGHVIVGGVPVPEPSSIILMSLAGLGLFAYARRRRVA